MRLEPYGTHRRRAGIVLSSCRALRCVIEGGSDSEREEAEVAGSRSPFLRHER